MNVAPVQLVAPRGANLRIVALALIMAAASALMMIVSDRSGALTVGILGLVFFGGGGLYFLIKAIRRPVALELDGHGFVDHTSAVGGVRVPWAEVVDLSMTTVRGQEFITVRLRNPAAFHQHLSKTQLASVRGAEKMGLGSVNVVVRQLPMTSAEALELITRYWRSSQLPPPGAGPTGPIR